jgi:sulfide dehydrogenase cytochrome subunit
LRALSLVGLVALSAIPGLAVAAPPPGASSCTGCHAPAKGPATALPSIEGRDPAQLKALLDGFRSGAVPATVMNRIMLGFTPEEIAALAEWFGRKS